MSDLRPKEYRDRIFKKGRPHLRDVQVVDEEGNPGADMPVLWAAYKKGSFGDLDAAVEKNIGKKIDTPELFFRAIVELVSGFTSLWIVEDQNPHFNSKHGPVGMVVANYDGWTLTPYLRHFTWANPRNRVRSNVAFLQMIRYRKDVGVVEVNVRDNEVHFYKQLKKYVPLYFVGSIPSGYRTGGAKNIFFMNGKKLCHS